MSKTLQLLQILQAIALGFGWPIWRGDYPGGLQQVSKRQTSSSFLDWTVSEFTECSAPCDGGFRTRSVRCLNKDGIISPQDCDAEIRPDSYEFCNQKDCDTTSSDNDLLPPSGIYSFNISDGSSATLQFVNQGSGGYTVLLDTLETDNTRTKVNQIVSPEGTQTRITVTGATYSILIRQRNGEASLVVDEEYILSLNFAKQVSISSIESLTYQSNEIATIAGQILAENITTLVYYDGLRFYRFYSDIVTPLDGSGVLFYDDIMQQAVYSTDISLSTHLEQAIDTVQNQLGTDSNSEVIITPPTSPSQSTDALPTQPLATTEKEKDEQEEVTDEQEEVTDEPEEVTDDTTDQTEESSTDESEECDSSTSHRRHHGRKHHKSPKSKEDSDTSRGRHDADEDDDTTRRTPGERTITKTSRGPKTHGGDKTWRSSDKHGSGGGLMDAKEDTKRRLHKMHHRSSPRNVGDEATKRSHHHTRGSPQGSPQEGSPQGSSQEVSRQERSRHPHRHRGPGHKHRKGSKSNKRSRQQS